MVSELPKSIASWVPSVVSSMGSASGELTGASEARGTSLRVNCTVASVAGSAVGEGLGMNSFFALVLTGLSFMLLMSVVWSLTTEVSSRRVTMSSSSSSTRKASYTDSSSGSFLTGALLTGSGASSPPHKRRYMFAARALTSPNEAICFSASASLRVCRYCLN